MGESSLSKDDEMMAWQQTVVDHGSWLRGLIAARLDPGEPVDDILQETMQSAIQSGRPGEPVLDVKGWLGGIARNKVRQYIDRTCRERRFFDKVDDLGESARTQAVPVPIPDQFLLERERLDLVAKALAALDDETAALLRCKYLQGWSYGRIGKHLGLNADAVTNRLRKARRLLREEINRLYQQPENQ